jgi:RNA polymerase sigma-70 factor (ECF subfamily)
MGNDKECVVQQVDHRQIWIATDGSGAIDETRSGSHFTSAADAQTCALFHITDASSQNNTFRNRFPAGGLSLPTNDWSSLSTDPATLLKQVHQRDGGPNEPGEWLTNIADFMRESDAPPAIRAALYRATALIPGVKLLGPQSNPAGQSGLGVGFYEDGKPVSELIFDQQTAKLIGEESFDQNGKLVGWTAYLQSKIVNTLPNAPLEPANPPASSGPSTAAGTTTAPPPATTTTG